MHGFYALFKGDFSIIQINMGKLNRAPDDSYKRKWTTMRRYKRLGNLYNFVFKKV